MKQSDPFRENAENCAQLAERATDDATHKRYKRMEAAWRALAEEQAGLTGVRTGRRRSGNGGRSPGALRPARTAADRSRVADIGYEYAAKLSRMMDTGRHFRTPGP
jgi:hypothetical protein